MTFADLERQGGKRTTRKAAFLERMDAVTPWADLVAVMDPHRPHDRGGRGRRPWPTETLLRMYLAQCWLGLSDEGTEDACYDSAAVRRIIRLFGRQWGLRSLLLTATRPPAGHARHRLRNPTFPGQFPPEKYTCLPGILFVSSKYGLT